MADTRRITIPIYAGSDPAETIDSDDSIMYRDDDVYRDLDLFNRCKHAGGCVYLTKCGETRCIYCSVVVA